jgi:protein-L-isoaspartate(D-aspartate) O-methyltransferase
MATFDQRNLAYLTVREHRPTPEDGVQYEVGVIGHGPGGDGLVDRVLDAIRTWDWNYRSNSVDFEIEPMPSNMATSTRPDCATPSFARPVVQFAIDTPLSQVIVAWH